MYSFSKETTIGNLILSEYAEVIWNAESIISSSGFLRENDEELIDSHLFNLAQAEMVIDQLNYYLQDELSVGRLLGFLNSVAECIESMNLTVKEKKQRYVIIIINALASTLWSHPRLQKRFLERCRWQIGVDSVTWDTQTSRIRNATACAGTVSSRAILLRDTLYDQLGIPPEHRL